MRIIVTAKQVPDPEAPQSSFSVDSNAKKVVVAASVAVMPTTPQPLPNKNPSSTTASTAVLSIVPVLFEYRNRGSNLTPSCSCRLWNQGTWNQVSDLPAAGVGQGTVLIATG